MSSSVENNIAFDKQFKKASQTIKSRIQTMITEGSAFCCLNTNIFIEINDTSPDAESGDKLTLYSEKAKLSKWFHNLFLEELKNKVLNPIALEQMRLKGIEPKKQPRDIILIIVVPSDKRVHIGISIPDVEEYNNFNLKEFISNALKPINSYNMYFDDSDKINNENKLAFIEYSTDSEVKEIDNTITMFFNQLKKDNIYKDDESDDEYVNYLEGID